MNKYTKIIGVGLSKTGTTSLDAAFQILGYNSLHWGPRATELVVEKSWTDIHAGYIPKYNAFSDYPWNFLYRMFDNCYDCKFILTYRKSVYSWYESIKNHINSVGHFNVGRLMHHFEDPERDRQKMLNFYWLHNARVRQYFDIYDRNHDRFIEVCFEDGDGWEKICKFLNKPIPDLPFPHENRGSILNPNYRRIEF